MEPSNRNNVHSVLGGRKPSVPYCSLRATGASTHRSDQTNLSISKHPLQRRGATSRTAYVKYFFIEVLFDLSTLVVQFISNLKSWFDFLCYVIDLERLLQQR